MIGANMKKMKNPLSGVDRVKGYNIREVTGKNEEPTRDLKKTKEWHERNTQGNPKKKA